ncbi:MAG TPA: hypothetical protein VL882_22615 [Vicinamibacterales bacterium]|nr:hypothetical protein [Vicinamibacterales bacterium]
MNELANLAIDPGEFGPAIRDARAMFHSQAVQLPDVLATELLEQVTAHQLVAKCHEDAFFNLLATDGVAIGAGASCPSSEAGEAVVPVDNVTAAALAAFRQPREQELRPSPAIESRGIAV